MGMNNEIHFGNFSSSEIVALLSEGKAKGSKGKPYYTYIEEKNIERKLGRVLKSDFSSKETSWGHLMEIRAFGLLPTEYSLISTKTVVHEQISCWVGSPDCIKYGAVNTVCDIKGLQLRAFCKMIDAFKRGGIQEVRDVCDSGEKFYWQIISNGCLTDCRIGELILYCPFLCELEAIRSLAMKYDGPDPGRFKWIPFSSDDELPYLLEGGQYDNLNKLTFDLPTADLCRLHDTVEEAAKELIQIVKPQLV